MDTQVLEEPTDQYQQNHYQQTYSQPAPPQATTSGEAFSITSFVLGVYSLLSLNLISAIVGLVFGILARKRPGTHRTLNMWGIILNAVTLGIAVLAVVLILFLVFFFFTAMAAFFDSFVVQNY